MKKTIIVLSFLLIAAMIFSGCAKLVRSETAIVDAEVVATYHKNAWMQPIMSGKTVTFIHHSEQNCVVVEYDGVRLTIDDVGVYHQYKDKIGQTIQCKMVTDYYDDNTCKQYLKFGD